MTDASLQAPRLSEELARRGSRREVAVLLAAPVALVVAWFFGPPSRMTLAFDPANPTLLSAFGAHYVHATVDHLVGNLLVYLGAAGVGYPMALLCGSRRLYVTMVVGVLFVLPFGLSAFHLVLVGSGVILGFSGLGLAMVGLLPPVLFQYLRSRVHGAVSVGDTPGLFILGGAVAAWQAGGTFPAARPLAGAVAVVGLLALAPMAWRVRHEGGLAALALLDWHTVALPAAALILFFLVAATAIPTVGSTPGAGASLTVHLLGFSLGFVGAYVITGWWRLRAPPSPPVFAD